MKDNVKFSITIPAYKAQFLEECIDSILAQTYKNFELIIVNDASPQNLDSIVSKYDDPRIRYYKNKVGFGAKHVTGNWNKCLEYATGDYIICMGDDDKLLPNCLAEYLNIIILFPKLDIYHGMTMMINEKSQIIDIQEPRPIFESMYSMMYFRWFLNRTQYIGDWLFNTKALKEKGGFVNLPFAWESDDCTACIAAMRKGAANTCIPIFLYRVTSQTISSKTTNTKDKLKAHLKALDIYKSLLDTKPKSELDLFYYNKLANGLERHLSKSFGIDIAADIKGNPLHIFHWLCNKKKYQIPHKAITRAVFYSIRDAFSK